MFLYILDFSNDNLLYFGQIKTCFVRMHNYCNHCSLTQFFFSMMMNYYASYPKYNKDKLFQIRKRNLSTKKRQRIVLSLS